MKHFLLYGHGGSYNHGAEAIVQSTIALLRRLSPDCKITLSTHFVSQDRKFKVPADVFCERDLTGQTYNEIYKPTIERITPETTCLHIGGDNYCYENWQRWTTIHYAALAKGAYSILWSCSVEPSMLNDAMISALRSHHLITARESVTYDALIACGCSNVIKVKDIAFGLRPKPVKFTLENYIVINLSPLVLRKNPLTLLAFQELARYILQETDLNIALLPHVTQPVDNDSEALQELNIQDTARVKFVSDNLSAAELKYIISCAKFCVATRTHVTIAAYSSGVPTIAVGYSSKASGIAKDLKQVVLDANTIMDKNIIAKTFKKLFLR
jgi:polysaccharide pyruvyl transferase WcaK-like protein